MASEAQYVTCKELHNPPFIPYDSSTENEVSRKNRNLQSEAVSGSTRETALTAVEMLSAEEGLDHHVSQSTSGLKDQSNAYPDNKIELRCLDSRTDINFISPSVMMFPAEDELPHAGKWYETASQIQSVIVRPSASLVSLRNRQSLQENSLLPGTPLDERTNDLTVDDRPQTPAPDIHTGHTSHTCGAEATQRLDNPITPDQADDDVQFILSVAKKKRKKRARLDFRAENNSQTSKGPPKEDNCEDATHREHHNERPNPQAACLETVGYQNAANTLPGIKYVGDGKPVQSPTTGSVKFPELLPTASASKLRNKTKRKNGEDQSHNLPEDLLVHTVSALNNGYPHIATPLLYQHQYSSQSLSMKPLTRMQDLSGIDPAGVGQSSGKMETRNPLGHGWQSGQATASSAQSRVYWPVRPVPNPDQVQCMSHSTTESLRRRPSLYGIPQWHASPLDRGMHQPKISESEVGSHYQSPYGLKNGDLNVAPQSHFNKPGNDTMSLPSSISYGNFPSYPAYAQPLSIQQPKAPLAGVQSLQPKHPKNMLVDIAQTCQDNFPFALVAKRHNQPIQKVFDIFSAVIQLPLLRSAVDARRPGKLGSFRMKEFNAMKRNAKQIQREKQAKKKGNDAEGMDV